MSRRASVFVWFVAIVVVGSLALALVLSMPSPDKIASDMNGTSQALDMRSTALIGTAIALENR